MNFKVLKVGLILVVILLVVLGVGYYFLFSSEIVKAQLNIDSGEVLVNGITGYSMMKLKQGDVIDTGADGRATIILYGSIVISLESNTKVSLDDLTRKNPQVSQEGGQTWNTFTKLSGVESYNLKNGEAIASVRGTSFGIRDGYILGGEGDVLYITSGSNFSVSSKKVVEIIDGVAVERDATPEEIENIRAQMIRAIEDLQALRDEVFENNVLLVKMIKQQTGLSEEKLRDYLRQIDDGDIDLDDLMSKSPIDLEIVKRIEDITRAILKIKAKIILLDD
ncbi:MAG: FecR domain-containing protein [archaeon]